MSDSIVKITPAKKRRQRRFKMDNHLPQKHYLGVLARAAWFAYLSPADTDQLYYNWGRDSTTDGVSGEKENAFFDFMSVLATRPVYIHSAKSDTDSFLIETLDHEIWVVWRGTQATLEDGFSLRDLYADVRFRLCCVVPITLIITRA